MNSSIISYAWVLLIGYIIVGFFFPIAGLAAVLCMSAPVIVSFFKGRLWCGKFCPRGLFLNILPGGRKYKLPGVLRSKYFRFAFLIILMGAFTVQLSFTDGSFTQIGIIFHRMVVITTIAAVAGGLIFGKRTWCTVCPMGTLAHYASPAGKIHASDKGRVAGCGACGASGNTRTSAGKGEIITDSGD